MASRLAAIRATAKRALPAVVEFIHTADACPRRHHRRVRSCAADARPCTRGWGQRHHGAPRRLPVHQVDGARADARFARARARALRRHAAHDRGRALSAHEERRRRHHRRGALRHHPPEDGVSLGGCAQIGGMLGKISLEREQALREYGSTRHRLPGGGRSARLHGAMRRPSASRSGATCARAR